MKRHYDLIHGKPNPYAARLGARGRADFVRWWADVTARVRVLPKGVAQEFPDTESTVEALRLVIKLRAAQPRKAHAPARKRRSAKRRSRTG